MRKLSLTSSAGLLVVVGVILLGASAAGVTYFGRPRLIIGMYGLADAAQHHRTIEWQMWWNKMEMITSFYFGVVGVVFAGTGLVGFVISGWRWWRRADAP